MKNKILVMIPCFTKKDYPQDNIYCPIEVGAYYKKIHFLSLRDDQGTNISDRFETFQGLSALYFAYQNLTYDTLGVLYDNYYFTKNHKRDLNKVITENDIVTYLNNYSLIFPKKKLHLKTTNHQLLDEYYSEKVILAISNLINKEYNDYFELFKKYLKMRSAYQYPLFIIKKEEVEEFLTFFFGILFKIEKITSDNLNQIATMIMYLYIKKNKKKCKHVSIINMSKTPLIDKVYNALKKKK